MHPSDYRHVLREGRVHVDVLELRWSVSRRPPGAPVEMLVAFTLADARPLHSLQSLHLLLLDRLPSPNRPLGVQALPPGRLWRLRVSFAATLLLVIRANS